jgi:hypothetical protein
MDSPYKNLRDLMAAMWKAAAVLRTGSSSRMGADTEQHTPSKERARAL